MQVNFSDPAQVEQVAIDAKAEALKINEEPYTVQGGIQLGILNELVPLLEEYAEQLRGFTKEEEPVQRVKEEQQRTVLDLFWEGRLER